MLLRDVPVQPLLPQAFFDAYNVNGDEKAELDFSNIPPSEEIEFHFILWAQVAIL